jgi:hypothetical protein
MVGQDTIVKAGCKHDKFISEIFIHPSDSQYVSKTVSITSACREHMNSYVIWLTFCLPAFPREKPRKHKETPRQPELTIVLVIGHVYVY